MTKKPKLPARLDKIASPPKRKKPVPIPGRVSNSELQAEIDATLDIRILGDTKLRNATRTDLFRSAEQDEKAAKILLAEAISKRELGRRIARLKLK
jgi:hypothetical protein